MKRMTFRELLLALSATKDEFNWSITEDGLALRAEYEGGYWCPITAVCRLLTSETVLIDDWERAAEVLDLPYLVATRIADAADNLYRTDTSIREQLLKAVGLSKD